MECPILGRLRLKLRGDNGAEILRKLQENIMRSLVTPILSTSPPSVAQPGCRRVARVGTAR